MACVVVMDNAGAQEHWVAWWRKADEQLKICHAKATPTDLHIKSITGSTGEISINQ